MTTFSTALKLELIGDGQQSGTWGQTTNKNLGTLLEQAITGVQSITMLDANYTLTNLNGVSDEARNAVIVATGTNSAVRNIIIPSVNKLYTVTNNTTGGYAIGVKTATGVTYTIPSGQTITLYCDGTDVHQSQTMSTTPTVSDNSQALATTAFVRSLLPSGIILMWYGSVATIPSGWYLCNGTNGTPNLMNRFIVGAGSTYSPGVTGGSTDATLVSHSHTVSASGSGTTSGSGTGISVNGVGDHTHGLGATAPTSGLSYQCVSPAQITGTYIGNTFGAGAHSHSINDPGHAHSFSVGVSGSTSTEGSSGVNANLPPYYALCYIMKA